MARNWRKEKGGCVRLGSGEGVERNLRFLSSNLGGKDGNKIIDIGFVTQPNDIRVLKVGST